MSEESITQFETILGSGAGGPLSPPQPWGQFSGYLGYAGNLVVGNPTGGSFGGPGAINATAIYVNGNALVTFSGGSFTGPVVLAADPTVALGATTKQYVDNHIPADAPTDGNNYIRKNLAWVLDPIQTDVAAADNIYYNRRNRVWTADPLQNDAPNDGNYYSRRNNGWAIIPSSGLVDAPSDGSTYGRLNGAWSNVLDAGTF
jgi:hypothetical protein